MTPPRRRGFAILLVLPAIVMAGLALSVLSRVSTGLLADAKLATHQARQRNLKLSAQTWARRQPPPAPATQAAPTLTRLDTTALGLPEAVLEVTLTPAAKGRPKAQVRCQLDPTRAPAAKNPSRKPTPEKRRQERSAPSP